MLNGLHIKSKQYTNIFYRVSGRSGYSCSTVMLPVNLFLVIKMLDGIVNVHENMTVHNNDTITTDD